jgi:hypothetical protein
MSISSAYIQKWLRKPGAPGPSLKDQTHATRDLILNDEHFLSPPNDIFGFAMVLILSSKPSAANRVLSTLFKIPEFTALTPGQRPQFFSGCKFNEAQKLALELFWGAIPNSGRPENTPWATDVEMLEGVKQKNDPGTVDFYEKWTNSEDVAMFDAPGSDFDAHFWKESEDPFDLALCAKILCRPRDEKVPSREKVEESFEAIDKLFTTLGGSGKDLPMRIYFILAVWLGRREKAIKILERAYSRIPGQFLLHTFMDIPQLYELLATSSLGDTPPLRLLGGGELVIVEEELLAALTTRIERDWKPPLHDVPMAELLRKFSEAAFFVNRDEYVKRDVNSPKEILCGPCTEEEVATVERDMGPLPPDVKEMALIADGFHGGWHFAGGGWGGIQWLWKDKAVNHEVQLRYEPTPVKQTQTRTREDGSTYEVEVNVVKHGGDDPKRDWEYVYCVNPVAETDGYLHLVCPEEVWRKMQEVMGKTARSGEYAYLHYAHWTDGGEIFHSVRDWIATMTILLETDVEAGRREECPA